MNDAIRIDNITNLRTRLLPIVAKWLNVSEECISDNTDIYYALDSLDRIAMIQDIEVALAIHILDDDMDSLRNFEQLLTYVLARTP